MLLQTAQSLFKKKTALLIIVVVLAIACIGGSVFYTQKLQSQTNSISQEKADLKSQFEQVQKDFNDLKNQDQVKKNQQLQEEINNINKTYTGAVTAYQELLDIKLKSKKTDDYDKQYANSLKLLADRKYNDAQKQIDDLRSKIKSENDKLSQAAAAAAAQVAKIPENAPANNTPPGSGYSRQKVHAETGDYIVDIISADMNSTRVIVDTASDGDCSDNCPALPLGDYVSRSGAYAGVNGSYFCPASYPQCAGKTNSFDTLLMNKNKVYFNSANNVYSTVPAVIFTGNSARFVGQSLEWGRDTGVDSMIANHPQLLAGGNITFGGGSDPKQGSKGARSFVGSNGSNIVYIGVVQNATVAEVAVVLKAMGLQYALNLDSGGSTALWSGGYKVGPGRNIPNALLFVNK